MTTAIDKAALVENAQQTAGNALLRLRAVGKAFDRRVVLESVSLDIERGEFLTILGESGSGKTTLLRIIAGFEDASSGDVLLDGNLIGDLPAYRRPVNTVFQNYALFPHLSVFDNVAYGLRVHKRPRPEIAERVESALRLVRMEGYANAAPRTISGGQKQRVALARALVNRPKVILLDEPLSALDANLRGEMQRELKQLQEQLGITFLFVTHDQNEAMAISDRIVLLHRGRIEQCGSPCEIYQSPRTRYVAEFLGKSNIVTATVTDAVANCGFMRFNAGRVPNGRVLYSLRPECIQPVSQNSFPDAIRFSAVLEMQQFHGASQMLTLRCADGTRLTARVPSASAVAALSAQEFACRQADLVQLEDER